MNQDLADRLRRRLEALARGSLSAVPKVAGSHRPAQGTAAPNGGDAPAAARRAAVLVLLYPHQDAWHLPLTLRPAHLADHAGQISLPGGAIEEGETSREAAVREFHEELGAEGLGMEFCGRLSRRYVSVSNFRITPWVAVTDRRPDWRPDPAEVAQLMEIPLAHLLDPASLGSHRREQRGESYVTPHFTWQSYRIWGATFAILSELAAVLAFEAV